MGRVLLLSTTTGYQIRAFGEAAGAAGVRLTIASDRCDRLDDPWWDRAIPVKFHDVDRSTATIVAALDADPPRGVIAVGDRPVELAARVCSAFGLPGNTPEAAAISRNKLRARQAFSAAGLLVPPFFTCLSMDDSIERHAGAFPYPVVVKPLALSGSRGVIRVDSPDACVAAFDRIARILRSPDVRVERDAAHDQVLVESFIPGAEYALEGVLTTGRLTVLALFDKPDPLDGPFFEETIYVTPSAVPPDTERLIGEAIAAAARAMGLAHGPVHAECRVHAGSVHVLEVAARPIGGLCSRALRFVREGKPGTLSLEGLLLRHAIGEDVSAFVREPDASGVMMIPIPERGVYRGVEGVDDALAVPGVADVIVTAKPDTLLTPLPEGRSYLGFIFARGCDARSAERALRDAHARLRFAIDRAVPIADRA